MNAETKECKEHKAGDMMILEKRGGGGGLKKVQIARVTKTQIVIEQGTHALRFHREGRNVRLVGSTAMTVHHYEIARQRMFDLFDFTEEAWEERTRLLEVKKLEIEARREKEKKRLQKIKDRKAAEVSEVKKRCLGVLPISSMHRNPDGSRLYTMTLPVNPEYVEHKNGWETLIVCCKDVEVMDWTKLPEGCEEPPKVKLVEFSVAGLHGGNSCGFLTSSSDKAGTDEDALWRAVTSAYFHW